MKNDCYYYLSVEETQKIALEIMKALHSYCVEHNLRYCLAWGTLLGAIRHKGFIPWDNDMDIFMSRKDIKKLLHLNKKKPISSNIQLLSYCSDDNYHYTVVRACDNRTTVSPSYLRHKIKDLGIWVDIVPLDGFNGVFYLLQKPIIFFYQKILNAIIYKIPPEKKLKKFLQKIIVRLFSDNNHKYERIIDSVSQWSNYDHSQMVTVFNESDCTPISQLMSRKDFENSFLTEFEDACFFIPQNADKILTATYGDYMQLPPENERQTHDIKARWI